MVYGVPCQKCFFRDYFCSLLIALQDGIPDFKGKLRQIHRGEVRASCLRADKLAMLWRLRVLGSLRLRMCWRSFIAGVLEGWNSRQLGPVERIAAMMGNEGEVRNAEQRTKVNGLTGMYVVWGYNLDMNLSSNSLIENTRKLLASRYLITVYFSSIWWENYDRCDREM